MPSLKLDRKGKLVVPESSLESAVATLMQLDGWRYFHTEYALTQGGRPVLEPNMPDAFFIRYLDGKEGCGCPLPFGCCCSHTIWVEFKRVGKKATGEQRLWHAAERKRGAIMLVAGVDFTADTEGFKVWYRASGLMRRPL